MKRSGSGQAGKNEVEEGRREESMKRVERRSDSRFDSKGLEFLSEAKRSEKFN